MQWLAQQHCSEEANAVGTRLCPQRTCHFTLAVGYSKHTPIIGVFSPLRTPSDHSEMLMPQEESWQDKCEPKRTKLTCSNVKHLTPHIANSGTPEFNENPAHTKNPAALSFSSLHEQLRAPGAGRVRQNQMWRWTEHVPSPRTTSGAATDLLGWGAKGENRRAQGKVSLHLLGVGNKSHTLNKPLNVWFWCHGNLQKELHNGRIFLEGLYELKYCSAMTRFPKIASLSTRKAAQMPNLK